MLGPRARDPARLTEATSALIAKHGDQESTQLIRVIADPFPLEALARFLVASMPLAPGDIRSLIDLHVLIRRTTLDRFAPIPKLTLAVFVGTMLFLLKEIPQVVFERIGIDHDQYQLLVAVGGVSLFALFGGSIFIFWGRLRGLRLEFLTLDRLLGMAALVSGVGLQGRTQDSKGAA
jgi:hypothetical protein